MRSLFDEFFVSGFGEHWPEYRIAEDKDNFNVILDLPGVTPESLKVGYEGGMLSVAAKSVIKGYTRTYNRTWEVPPEMFDVGKINAEIEHGILTLTLPKLEAAKPRYIEVKPGKTEKTLTPRTEREEVLV